MDLAHLNLPDRIHAAVFRLNDVRGIPAERAVVWADRAYHVCETCEQAVPQVAECPVVPNDGLAGAPLTAWSQRHSDLGGSCGIWQPVLWEECGTSDDEITAAALALATRRNEEADANRSRLTTALREQLAAALASLDDPWSDRTGITTGSDAQPGIYFDEFGSGEWVAWDYDPDDDSETITVCASDLA